MANYSKTKLKNMVPTAIWNGCKMMREIKGYTVCDSNNTLG